MEDKIQNEKTIIYELFELANEDFKNHLNIVGNERIIFSGKFGVGKSTFLKNFFEEGKQINLFGKKKFNPIYLFPVNYSVASNEDIFKYIKYDILYELILKYNISLDGNDFSPFLTSQFYLSYNLPKIIASVISFFPKVGKVSNEFYDKFSKIHEELIDFYKKSNEGEDKDIKEFYEMYVNQEGSIYEYNLITKLIENKLEELKGDDEIENVLIIEDLDRIDPHHIFRLFNVFAAHFDNKEYDKNKFGFDKVIFVCDIENIRNIFRHQYGINTDFSGYIDKFYSKNIFDFRFSNYLYHNFDSIFLRKISFKYMGRPAKDVGFYSYFIDSFKYVLLGIIESDTVSLRKLFKYHLHGNIEFSNKKIIFNRIKDESQDNWSNIPVLVLDALISLFGDRDSLKASLLQAYETRKLKLLSGFSKELSLYELGFMIPLLDRDKFAILRDGEALYYNNNCNLIVKYVRGKVINRFGYNAEIKSVEYIKTGANEGNIVTDDAFVFYLYYEIIVNLERLGYYHSNSSDTRHL